MYLKIRRLDRKSEDKDIIINISKRALIQEMRKLIFQETQIEVDKQRLFYKGKQLIDDHKILDYDIQLNDVIQLMVKVVSIEENEQIEKWSDEVSTTTNSNIKEHIVEEESLEEASSQYFKVGDAVDCIEETHGAWIEAHIKQIFKRKDTSEHNKLNKEPDIIFRITYDRENDTPVYYNVTFELIRPKSRHTYKKSELAVGQIVMVNYNTEDPSTRGYWYDLMIKKLNFKTIVGTIFVGKERTALDNCTIRFIDQVFRIEKTVFLSCRSEETDASVPLRTTVYYCEKCKDVTTKSCKYCGCKICSGKENANLIILCDECNFGFHIGCLTPPLKEVPADLEWYCPLCKIDENEIVKAGDKLKFSKKKSRMVSTNKEGTSRDWGRGMACVGRTKECTIVPKAHYGPVPGIDVGTCWKFRVQVSEAGIHRPHVAGIHGRETDGAYSLVLSGGYEGDVDNGDEFIYSGSGGRDLSGNKRVSGQSCNQTLTRMNKALALNCNAPLNKNGAEAKNWQSGKPVRVVRNYKIGKHSKYAPKDGNRYDGIYKVVKYYPEKGPSGFIIWRYFLKRDDSEPAPWTKEGHELEMIYPPGYLDAQAVKTEKESDRGVKRSASNTNESPENKKKNIVSFKLGENVAKSIENDSKNHKLWDECKKVMQEGKQPFLSKVEELFTCICCQELVYRPITTECKHNVCKSCLQRSFDSEIYTCPYCRFELGKKFEITINQNLSKVLLALFPGYESGR